MQRLKDSIWGVFAWATSSDFWDENWRRPDGHHWQRRDLIDYEIYMRRQTGL